MTSFLKSRIHLALVAVVLAAAFVAFMIVGRIPARAEIQCGCAVDAQGRTDVRSVCTGVDWNDPLQGNQAIAFAARCAGQSTAKTVYFPAGEYAVDSCSATLTGLRAVINQAQAQAPAGSPAGAEVPGGTLKIVGDGMNSTVIYDRPGNDPNCNRDGYFGAFVKFAPGGGGELQDLSIIGQPRAGHRSAAYVIYGTGGWVKTDGSIQPTVISAVGVKAEHWGRFFVGSGDTAQATEFTMESSVLRHVHQGIINGRDDAYTLPDGTYKRYFQPHQIIRILNSTFDHVGQRCTNQDHGMYIRAPFNELTVEGNTFLNSPGYAVHRYGGFFFVGDERGFVNVKNNTFRQPDLEADPLARDLCDCRAGEPNCAIGPDGKDERRNIYDSGYILFDGPGGQHPQDYDVTITGNAFWGGNAIQTSMPSTIKNNVFRTPDAIPMTAAAMGQRGPSVFSDNQSDGTIFVLAGADETVISNNTCIECSKEFDHGSPMVSVDAPGVRIENNAFVTGTGKYEVKADDVTFTGNTLRARPGKTTTPLMTVSGDRAVVTGNAMTISGPAIVADSGALNGTFTNNAFTALSGADLTNAVSIPASQNWTVGGNGEGVAVPAPVSAPVPGPVPAPVPAPVPVTVQGPVTCTCPSDPNADVDVRKICVNVDWNDPLKGNEAVRQATQCALDSKARTLHFSTGTYATSACAAGALIAPGVTGSSLTISGAGASQSVIDDRLVAEAAGCAVGNDFGTLVSFPYGAKGTVRDLTLRHPAGSLKTRTDAIRTAGSAASAAARMLGGIVIQSVRFENWNRAVSIAADTAATVTNSSFVGNRTAVAGESGSRLGKVGYNTFDLQAPAGTTDAGTVGVDINQAKGWTVFGNIFRKTGTGSGSVLGVWLAGSGARSELYALIVQNRFQDLRGSGIRAASGASGLQIIGNTFEGDDLGQGALRIESTAANPNRCIVIRNCFKTPKDMSIAVQGCVVRSNVCQ